MTILFELLLLTCGNYYGSYADKMIFFTSKNIFESMCSSVLLASTYYHLLANVRGNIESRKFKVIMEFLSQNFALTQIRKDLQIFKP